MDNALRWEINSCIRELMAIASELEDAADEISQSISGMNTRKYTNGLYSSARKYRKAADNLKRIE